jgi:hypothetical protein
MVRATHLTGVAHVEKQPTAPRTVSTVKGPTSDTSQTRGKVATRPVRLSEDEQEDRSGSEDLEEDLAPGEDAQDYDDVDLLAAQKVSSSSSIPSYRSACSP